jgi:hypothetical protein
VTSYTEGFSHFVTSMTAPVASGWSGLPGGARTHWKAPPCHGARVQQTVPIAKVDVQTVAAGYRASKVIGSSVLNEGNETIGKIDDLLVTRDGKEPYAVLSIGGFLGLGTHMVVVRYDSLRFDPDNKIVLPGGTKEGLTMLPPFEYAKQ